MKKIIALVLAAMMMLACASSCLAAASGYYSDGKLTVTVDASETYRAVEIDGKGVNAIWPGETSATYSVKEKESYTVHVEGEPAFTVKGVAADPTEAPTTAPTEAPTEAPTTEPTGRLTIVGTPTYDMLSSTLHYTVSGVREACAVAVDGKPVDYITSNGSQTATIKLAEGTHTLTVRSDVYNENDSKDFVVTAQTPTITGHSYKVGTLTYTVAGVDGACEVELDGKPVDHVNSNGSQSISVTLTEGPHTMKIYNALTAKGSTYNFTQGHIEKVIPAVEPTCTDAGLTAGKVCEICGKVLEEQKVVPALGHDVVTDAAVAATCTEAGKTAGEHCARCGLVIKAQEVVAALGHDVVVDEAVEPTCTKAGKTAGEHCARCGLVLKAQEDVKALGHWYVCIERTITKATYRCQRCGDTFTIDNDRPVKNAYGSIVKDATGKDVDYTALINGKTVEIVADLTCKPDLTTELGLYLDEALIAQLQKDHCETVTFVNGEATIIIKLADIKAEWFATEDVIMFYVFSTDPAVEEGTLVKVEAQIVGEEKIPATEFTGVTLKKVEGDVEITANGIY